MKVSTFILSIIINYLIWIFPFNISYAENLPGAEKSNFPLVSVLLSDSSAKDATGKMNSPSTSNKIG